TYFFDGRSRLDLRVQLDSRLDACVAGIARWEALDLGAHGAEGRGGRAARGCHSDLVSWFREEAAVSFEDVHRPGHPLPGRQGTEHTVAGVVGRGGRLPVGDLPAAAAVQGEMRRDGHADGLAHLDAAEAEQTRGYRDSGDHLEARAAP